jgi:PRC-barrel domain
MSGGFYRHGVSRCIVVWMLLTMLAGCSALFGPKPPPVTEQPAPEPQPEPEPAAPPEPEASAPAPASAPAVPEVKRAPPKPVHRHPPPHRPAPPETPPAPAPVVPAPIVSTRLLSSNDTRGLLDARVQRPDGKALGRAIDMFVDKDGRPQEMLVNLSGFLGIGDRKVRFPWNAFTFNMSAKKAAITLAVKEGQPPAAQALHKKGARPAGIPSKPELTRMIDATVERVDGARVGRVVDVLIDNHAAPQAAVVDVSRLMQDRRSIAIDWSALRFVHKNDALQVESDLTDAQVDAAPNYEPDRPVRAVSPAPKPPIAAQPAAAGAKPAASGNDASR